MDQCAIFLPDIVSLAAMAPVKPAIRMKEGAVYISSVPGVFEATDDHFALVRNAVAIRVGQLPDSRRRGHIERPIEPNATLRKCHPIGEHADAIVTAIAVRIGEK